MRSVVSRAVWGFATVMAFVMAMPALSCPFCSAGGASLRERLRDADVAFIAELSEAKPNTSPGQGDGETKAHILHVLKPHEAVQNKKDIILPRFLPAAQTETVTCLLYAIVADGVVDPYAPELIDSNEFEKYVVGAALENNKPVSERLGYFFPYLGDANPVISQDAYTEFAAAPYADVKAAAKHYDADTLVRWIEQSNVQSPQSYRLGLYGLLLGLCQRPQDKEVLLGVLNDPKKRPISGADGLLGGLCVLDPKGGTEYVLGVLNDPEQDFGYRYSALRAVRVLVSDIGGVDHGAIWKAMAPTIQIRDMSDLVIDEFRKNKVWDYTPQILAIFDNKKFDVQVIKRAVVRYALRCPDPAATAFVERLRKDDPQLVKDVEEILRFEEARQAQPKDPAKPAA